MNLDDARAKIQSLTELYERLQQVRRAPHSLLQNRALLPSSLALDFQQLKALADSVCSDSIQNALAAAKASEKADNKELPLNYRRDNRKRKRPFAPESPMPYTAPDRTNAPFPVLDEPAVTAAGLFPYIREFNLRHLRTSSLRLWLPARTSVAPVVDSLVTLRFTIPDVLVAFIGLAHDSDNPEAPLAVLRITAFGPREWKAPHTQSSFVVYQMVTEQLASMLQEQPKVALQNVLDLLQSYAGMFVDRCTRCSRILSSEGHVPPVVRIWTVTGHDKADEQTTAVKEDRGGSWAPRHITCRHG